MYNKMLNYFLAQPMEAATVQVPLMNTRFATVKNAEGPMKIFELSSAPSGILTICIRTLSIPGFPMSTMMVSYD